MERKTMKYRYYICDVFTNKRSGIEVVAINDITDNEALAYLLRHDTVMGNPARPRSRRIT